MPASLGAGGCCLFLPFYPSFCSQVRTSLPSLFLSSLAGVREHFSVERNHPIFVLPDTGGSPGHPLSPPGPVSFSSRRLRVFPLSGFSLASEHSNAAVAPSNPPPLFIFSVKPFVTIDDLFPTVVLRIWGLLFPVSFLFYRDGVIRGGILRCYRA